MGNTTSGSYIRYFQEEITMKYGFYPYRTSGYNLLVPSSENVVLKSIKKYAFPKKPIPVLRSMVLFTKDKCLELLNSIANFSKSELLYYRDQIDKLGFSAYEYMAPHTIVGEFDRDAGDIVVISYPDKIEIPSSYLGVQDNSRTELSLVGYFYK